MSNACLGVISCFLPGLQSGVTSTSCCWKGIGRFFKPLQQPPSARRWQITNRKSHTSKTSIMWSIQKSSHRPFPIYLQLVWVAAKDINRKQGFPYFCRYSNHQLLWVANTEGYFLNLKSKLRRSFIKAWCCCIAASQQSIAIWPLPTSDKLCKNDTWPIIKHLSHFLAFFITFPWQFSLDTNHHLNLCFSEEENILIIRWVGKSGF